MCAAAQKKLYKPARMLYNRTRARAHGRFVRYGAANSGALAKLAIALHWQCRDHRFESGKLHQMQPPQYGCKKARNRGPFCSPLTFLFSVGLLPPAAGGKAFAARRTGRRRRRATVWRRQRSARSSPGCINGGQVGKITIRLRFDADLFTWDTLKLWMEVFVWQGTGYWSWRTTRRSPASS